MFNKEQNINGNHNHF